MANPSWYEHPDLMQAAIVIIFAGFVWFAVRTLRKIDANQSDLYKKHDNHEQRLSYLEGAHEARVNKLNC